MIALGLRLAMATRQAQVRLALTAFAVAAGVVLVLGAFAVPAAHDQSRLRDALLNGQSGSPTIAGPAILWNSALTGVVDGNDAVRVIGAAATGPGAPSLPDGTAVPTPGRMLVSPALAAALRREGPGGRLAAQLPLTVVGAAPRALLPNPDDRVAIVGQTRASLHAGVRITHWQLSDRSSYLTGGNSPFERIIRLLTPILILVPILVLVATAARIGRRRRDGQLAALRLMGAGTRQLALLATTEAVVASVVGAIVGAATYTLLVRTLTTIPLPTETLFGADMVPPTRAVVIALVGIPVAAAAAVLLSVGRALSQPLAVRRGGAPTRPSVWRVAPLAVGWAGLVVTHWLGLGLTADLVVVASGALLVLGIVLAGPWMVHRGAGALLLAFRGRPAALISGRRLLSDSAGGFRAVTGIAAAAFILTAIGVFFAGAAAADHRLLSGYSTPQTGLGSIQLSEGRTEAEATGALRRAGADPVTVRGLFEETSGTLIAFADCGALRRLIPVTPDCTRPLVSSGHADLVGRDLRVGGSDGPRGTLRIVSPLVLPDAAVTAIGADALLPLSAAPAGVPADQVRFFLPAGQIDRASGALVAASVPAYAYVSGSITSSSGLDTLTLGIRGIVLLAFALGAITLAVGGVDDILERRRELARLQASGVGTRTLRSATVLEQIGPLAIGVLGATCAGLAVGSAFVLLPPSGSADLSLVIPWGQLALIPLLSAAAGAIVLAATLPVLGRAIRPEALRAE